MRRGRIGGYYPVVWGARRIRGLSTLDRLSRGRRQAPPPQPMVMPTPDRTVVVSPHDLRKYTPQQLMVAYMVAYTYGGQMILLASPDKA